MPDTKISNLPSASTPSGADILVGVQSSATAKFTFTQILSYIQSSISITGPFTLSDGSAAAPSYAFSGATGTGMYRDAGGGRIRFAVGGTYGFNIAGTAIGIASDSAQIQLGASADTIIVRDAANTLAIRNGVNAQALRVYNTYTDASNYERAGISWETNTLFIGTQLAGTGSIRDIIIRRGATSYLGFGTSTGLWNINSAGHFVTASDNTYDIGASGANRVRSGYFGTNVVIGYSTTSTAQLHVGGGGVQTVPNGAGVNVVPQIINSQTSGSAHIAVAVNDGTNNRRASLFVDQTNGLWGLSGTASNVLVPFVIRIGAFEYFRLSEVGVATFYGNVLAGTDATFDLGQSAASRFRDAFFSRNLTAGTGVTAGTYLRVNGTNTGYIALGTADDVILVRDGTANTLALRNGTNAQEFRLYNTTDGGSNYARLRFYLSGSTWTMATQSAGTGPAQAVSIESSGNLSFGSGGTANQWRISSGVLAPVYDAAYDLGGVSVRVRDGWFSRTGYFGTSLFVGWTAPPTLRDGLGNTFTPTMANMPTSGVAAVMAAVMDGTTNRRAGLFVDSANFIWGLNYNFSTGSSDFVITHGVTELLRLSPVGVMTVRGNVLAGADNTYDIGASGANRPRDLFLGRNIIAGGYVLAGSSNSIGWSNRAVMQSTADGRILLLNSAGTDFSRLMIGGSTSSYPAIGRDNADLSIILADNSANTGLIVSYVRTVATVVASLPSAATAGAGARAFVTDATATTFASVVSGGGANSVPVYSDGTQWLIG